MKRIVLMALAVIIYIFMAAPVYASESAESEIFDKSEAENMYEALSDDTKELLSDMGVESAGISSGLDFGALFDALSKMLQDKLTNPIRTLAAFVAIFILCRLACAFENSEIGNVSMLVGTFATGALAVAPIMDMINSLDAVSQSVSVFLLSSIPIYSGLMIASGQAISGTSYGMLTLAAANAIPIISTTTIIPMLNIFLALSVSTAVSKVNLNPFINGLYSFAKWILVLAVTIFTGVLSIQTLLNLHVDGAGVKMEKLIASSTIPIVGSTLGDALSLIKSSVQIVKSGVGAFGILAALLIFIPPLLETFTWMSVFFIADIIGNLLEVPSVSKFLNVCLLVLKMLFAVLVSLAMVSVVCAAVVLFAKDGV